MPTKPLESILYREPSIAEARKYIDVASPLLKELVNYSTNLFARCGDSAKGEENEDGSVFSLFKHIIEMTDGIDVHVSQSCAVPAIPLVRSSFEALLAMQYILESDNEYVKRPLSWMANYINDRISQYKLLDPDTQEGRQFRENAKKDSAGSRIDWADIDSTKDEIQSLEKVLARAQFKDVEAERKSQRRKRPQWYSLFGGPQNLRILAQHLERGAQYVFLYRQWSSVSHAVDFPRFAAIPEKGERYIERLRNPKRLEEVMRFAPTFILEAIRLMTQKCRPGEMGNFSRWYMNEVQEKYKLITFTG